MLGELHSGSPVRYVLQFAAGFMGMMMVLSGMIDLKQIQDNISFMKDFKSLNEKEFVAGSHVRGIFKSKSLFCFCALSEARLPPAFFL